MFNLNFNFMKTVKFLVSALLSGVLLVSTANASEGEKSTSSSSEAKNVMREQIANALSDITVANDQVVFIHFNVSDKKGFELVNVAGTNADLISEVKANLSKGSFTVPSELEGEYMVKVRFTDKEEVSEAVSTSDYLRAQLSDALSSVKAVGGESVKVNFSVKGNSLKVNTVEGESKWLTTSVEKALSNAKIDAPASLAGNYQVTVKF